MAQTPVSQSPVPSITKQTLTKNWGYLKDNIILEDMASKLIEYEVITPPEWQTLKAKKYDSEPCRTDDFLLIIHKKNEPYDNFAKAIESAGRTDILDVLQGRKETPKTTPHAEKKTSENNLGLMSEIGKMLDEKLKIFHGRFENMDEKLLQSNDEVKHLREDLMSGKVSYPDIQEKLKQKEAECKKFHEHNEFLEKQVDVLTQESIANEKRIQEMDKDIEIFKVQIKNMSCQQNNKQEEIEQLRAKLMVAEKDKETLLQKTASLNEHKYTCTQQMQRNSVHLSALQENLSSINRPWIP